MSLDTSATEGTLLSKLLFFSGHRLLVNADASGGSLEVELLDRDGAVIPGYSQPAQLPGRPADKPP